MGLPIPFGGLLPAVTIYGGTGRPVPYEYDLHFCGLSLLQGWSAKAKK